MPNLSKGFARAVVRLFKNRTLRYRLQDAGYTFADERYSWKVGLETLDHILDVADATWIDRRIAARQNRLAKFFSSD